MAWTRNYRFLPCNTTSQHDWAKRGKRERNRLRFISSWSTFEASAILQIYGNFHRIFGATIDSDIKFWWESLAKVFLAKINKGHESFLSVICGMEFFYVVFGNSMEQSAKNVSWFRTHAPSVASDTHSHPRREHGLELNSFLPFRHALLASF